MMHKIDQYKNIRPIKFLTIIHYCISILEENIQY